jgi:hypothetical protein
MSTQEHTPSAIPLTLFDLGPAITAGLATVIDAATVAEVRRAVAELDYPALLEEIINDRAPDEEITLTTLIRAEHKHELAQRDLCLSKAQDALRGGLTARGREWAILALVHGEKAAAAHLWLLARNVDDAADLAAQASMFEVAA